jgi:hypothetical protein
MRSSAKKTAAETTKVMTPLSHPKIFLPSLDLLWYQSPTGGVVHTDVSALDNRTSLAQSRATFTT